METFPALVGLVEHSVLDVPVVGVGLVLALPAIALLLLGERARRAPPTIRDWMNTNSWVVSEVVIAFFVIIEINSLLS